MVSWEGAEMTFQIRVEDEAVAHNEVVVLAIGIKAGNRLFVGGKEYKL
jgi:hypothetical protein